MAVERVKRVVILGSTGSIGRNALRVIRALGPKFQIIGLSTNRRVQSLARQAREFRPRAVVIADPSAWARRASLPSGTMHVWQGHEGMKRLAALPEADIVVTAVVGAAGLIPTLHAIMAGKRVAIANKEPLVMAGELMMRAAERSGASVLPIDSEHSALFQCLEGIPRAVRETSIRRLILTSSGGPFRIPPRGGLKTVTVEQALRHPTWRMGPKITIDSATLMNKGLEVIEAHWLFGVPLRAIEVLIHPQSVVHSMVEFLDGSVLAQLAVTDMRLPIQYALCYPERMPNVAARLNFTTLPPLTFARPSVDRFPALALAYRAARTGGTMPAVLNAANEEAVQAFLRRDLAFVGIPLAIERTMRAHRPLARPSIGQILNADAWARDCARAWIASHCRRRRVS